MNEKMILLIEKFNNKIPGLIEHICSCKEENISLSDNEVWGIKEALAVKSITEIAEHFEPQVEVLLGDERIMIPICHKDGLFWKMVHLWETIRQGEYSVITKEDLEEAILVKNETDKSEWLKAQEQIFTYIKQNKTDKAKEQIKACGYLFADNLYLIKELIKKADFYLNNNEKQGRRFMVMAEEDMSLQCISASKLFKNSRCYTKSSVEIYQQLLEEISEENPVLYWNLMLNCQSIPKEKREQLNKVLSEQKVIYEKAKESFLIQAVPMIQTLFVCRQYLKNAHTQPIIVTNCTVEELVQNRVIPAFERYIKTVNGKLYRNDAIKKVIIPNIIKESKRDTLTRVRFLGVNKNYQTEFGNNIEAVKKLYDIFSMFDIDTELMFCDEGIPLGYAMTGIDTIGDELVNQKQLRELTIWLDRWKLYMEEE